MSFPIRVLITGATGHIAYSLIPLVASGQVFGSDQPVILHLLDMPSMAAVLDGLVMEINDCAYPLVTSVVATNNEDEAFKDISSAFLIASIPREETMERKDLLAANVNIFSSQGKALANHSNPNVKVLVLGNSANTNALIALKFAAPKIPAKNFTAMTRLDENRAINQFATEKGVDAKDVSRLIIWGNTSSTQLPDMSNTHISGKTVPFEGHDEAFIKFIQRREESVMAAAKAAADHMHDWWNGMSAQPPQLLLK